MLLVSFARFMFRGSLQRQLYAPIYKVATKWVENTNSYASGFSGCNVASGRFLSLFYGSLGPATAARWCKAFRAR